MAVIGAIRKHSGLAVILVGVAIAAFVLSDLFKSGPKAKTSIGIINGIEIQAMDFNLKVDANIETQKLNTGEDNLTYDEIYTVKDNTWQQLVNEVLMDEEFDKIGLVVTADELFDQVQGPNPHRLILQYFTNPETGRYDRNLIINYLQNLDQLDATSRNQWLSFEQFIKRDRLNVKYSNLIIKGFYVPEAFARARYENQKKNAEFRYAYKKYAEIPDSLVSYTEDDEQRYYEENKYRFDQENTRDMNYVVFEVLPSEQDFADIEADVRKIFSDFTYAENVPSLVNTESDSRYDSSWYAQGTLPVMIDSVMFNSDINVFIEPYIDNEIWHMVKLEDVQSRPDSLKAEHILIAYAGAFRTAQGITRTKTQARELMDSLYNVISRTPGKLQELAVELSNDGSVEKNLGDLGWFPDGNMVYAFNEAVVEGNVGDITTAETIFGYHVIKITGKTRSKKKVRVAQITRVIAPSSATFHQTYMLASKFSGENNSKEKFDQAVIDQGLDKREATYVREMSNNIAGLENPRSMVRWLFSDKTNVGDVSTVFELEGKFIVAVATAERSGGIIPYEEMRDRLKVNVLNDAKGKFISQKINESNLTDIYQIAEQMNTSLDTNTTLTFSSRNIPGFGAENMVIGKIFTMGINENSGPIQGNGAVFSIVLDNINEAPGLGSYAMYKGQMATDFQRDVQNNYPYRAIEKNADIEDYRLLFY